MVNMPVQIPPQSRFVIALFVATLVTMVAYVSIRNRKGQESSSTIGNVMGPCLRVFLATFIGIIAISMFVPHTNSAGTTEKMSGGASSTPLDDAMRHIDVSTPPF